MALWGKNDAEGSKPSWLTEEQKRNCFRTIRGWEIPLAGASVSGDSLAANGATVSSNSGIPVLFRNGNYIGETELLVAMPFDPGVTGVTSSNMAGYFAGEARGITTGKYGATAGNDVPNFAPYFAAPVTGQSYAVSRGSGGFTAYIPIILGDANITDIPQKLTNLSFTGGTGGVTITLLTATGFTSGTFNVPGATTAWYNQPTTLIGAAATGFYDQATKASITYNQYGGWGGITSGAGVFRLNVTSGGPTGTFAYTLFINDGRSTGGKTGASTFTVVIT
jgi:hypothetical protein